MSETPLVSAGSAEYGDFRKKVAAIVFIVNKKTVLIIQQTVMLLQIFQRRWITAFYGIALRNAASQGSFQTFLLLGQSRFTNGSNSLYKQNKQYQKCQNRKQIDQFASEGHAFLLKTIHDITPIRCWS